MTKTLRYSVAYLLSFKRLDVMVHATYNVTSRRYAVALQNDRIKNKNKLKYKTNPINISLENKIRKSSIYIQILFKSNLQIKKSNQYRLLGKLPTQRYCNTKSTSEEYPVNRNTPPLGKISSISYWIIDPVSDIKLIRIDTTL